VLDRKAELSYYLILPGALHRGAVRAADS
jgi:hypothetical protein